MKTILVTGAAGFTGQHLVSLLKNQGHKVIALGFENVSIADRTFICDLTDIVSVDSVIRETQPDWVIHLAAVSFVAHKDLETLYKVNIVGTRNLLSALARLTKTPQSVLVASSATVYGNSPLEELDESAPLIPANDYGVSKLAMEHVVRLWQDKLPITIVRPFNYTGVGQRTDFLIPKIVDHFVRKSAVIELGNIHVEREFSDVRGVCHIYHKILESSTEGGIFNVCSGNAYSLKHILQMMSEISGHDIDIQVNPDFVRPNEIKRLVGSNSHLHQEIGTQIYINIQETLKWMYESQKKK